MRPLTGQRLTFLNSWPPLLDSRINASLPVLFVFYRGHWCDYCKEQFDELARAASSFKQRATQVAGVTSDNPLGITAMTERIERKLPILGDPEGELIRSLDLVDPWEFREVPVSLPAVFLVDGSGVVRFHYVGRSPDDRPRLELLLLAAERLSMEKC